MSNSAIADALAEQARNGDATTHPFFLEDRNGLRLLGSSEDAYKAEQILYSEPDNQFRTHGLNDFLFGRDMLAIFQQRFAKLRGEK